MKSGEPNRKLKELYREIHKINNLIIVVIMVIIWMPLSISPVSGCDTADATNALPLLKSLSVLLVEDSDNDALILKKMLERECERFHFVRVQNRTEMESALDQGNFDVILCDHDMPEFSALGALEVRNGRNLDIPFLIVTGAIGGEEVAIELMRQGVADFVPKHKMGRLVPALRREIREAGVREAKRDADEALRRKNAELVFTIERLTRSQAELVRAGRMKGLGKMAAGISHDLNNALSRALCLLESPESETLSGGSRTGDEIRKAINDATRVAKRLTYFCDVTPRQGKGKAVDISDVIAASLESCRGPLSADGDEARSIAVASVLRETPPVYGDENHFRDAVTTLLLDACDAMPDGGQLRISSYRNTSSVVVEIENNGLGVSQETRQRSLDPSADHSAEATEDGLGFAWIKALLERYGGIMRAESIEGLGTKIHLRFAICDEPEAEAAAGGEREAGEHSSLKILVVDDEPVIADCLSAFLQRDHHDVTTVHNGYDALETLRDDRFDLVISDRAMNDFGGEELARRLCERGSGEKFILATGSGDLLIASCRKLTGVDVILPKPITREALQRAILETGVLLPA